MLKNAYPIPKSFLQCTPKKGHLKSSKFKYNNIYHYNTDSRKTFFYVYYTHTDDKRECIKFNAIDFKNHFNNL